ncbi:hypothetical protein MHF_0462 [Mycoplasma haemofelis Ohio2]|uniref:Uncharacterized protein n=1 Tax=Mycoplasma haemofelis (strain Ohio2) TaxID=859194 RepID=F6FHJ9_MYCHI|nr:hypothetical protein MHF_0462 [Mycoplasma haemofelis Ohio2]
MNSTYLLGGLGALGAAGTGSLLALKPWNSNVETFKSKYSHALINAGDNSLWSNKFTLLKDSNPEHQTLKEAVNKAKATSPDEAGAKELLKRGCQEIYDSPYEGSKYLNDFEKYCSKTNKDASSNQTWNGSDVSTASGNKWDTALNALKTHDEATNKKLDSVLAELKNSIQGNTQITADHRTKLKNWCEGIKSKPYLGSDSLDFKHQELYCKHS